MSDPSATSQPPPWFLDELAKHRARVPKWLLDFGVRGEVVKDLAQDVEAAVLRYHATYDPRKSQFVTWLKRITRNIANKHFNATTDVPIESVEVEDPEDSPESKAFASELEAVLAGVLDTLDENHREVLRLRFGEGMRSAEIASELGIEEPTARSRLSRALEQCREGFRARKVNDRPGPCVVPIVGAISRTNEDAEGSAAGNSAVPALVTVPNAGPLRKVFSNSAFTLAGAVAGGLLVYWLLARRPEFASSSIDWGGTCSVTPTACACSATEGVGFGAQPSTAVPTTVKARALPRVDRDPIRSAEMTGKSSGR